MKLIATSDLHLGFRSFARLAEGRNAREQDVEQAWLHVVELILREQPDLVTIAGDVFHSVRPDFWAIKCFMEGIHAIATETDAQVIIIGGNHCIPRTAETLTPSIVAVEFPRVHLVTEPTQLRLRVHSGETVSISCFPFVALTAERKYSLDPDPSADVNVLLMHAAVREAENGDALPFFYGGDAALDIGREADRWDVIACGDYHEFRRLHPTALAFYSGSIERTSSDIWKEEMSKCVVLVDTTAKTMAPLLVVTRGISTETIGDSGILQPSAEDINRALDLFLADPDYSGRIVRLKVDDCPASQRDRINWSAVRELKQRCFHFQLDVEWKAGATVEFGDRRSRRGRAFEDDVAEYFAEDDVNVQRCALRYLQVAA